MKAVRLYDPLDIRYENIDKAADPLPGEIRVKVAYAGICGSDIHNYKTGQWISRRPSVAGHEFSGWVDAIGDGVEGFALQDKVIADSRYYCSSCANCQSGNAHLCENLGFIGEAIDGGFAEYVTLPSKLLEKCHPSSRLDIAALAEPLAVALHALKRLNIPDDEPLLIIGCGPIGALTAIASSCQSNRAVLVSDINKEREALVAELSNGEGIELASLNQFDNPTAKPLRYVLDTTGNVGVISNLIAQMNGCTIGLVGIGAGEFPFDPVHLVERELTVLGCHAYCDELRDALSLLEQLPERFEPVIGTRITLEETPDAYDAIAAGHANGIKTMIVINETLNAVDGTEF
ncbi:MAG: alcohol dehydrogenase catalytic domain-containing protein [Rhizobiales bacterium]|nr:alcohol dehydrogenase catalytic domain-containing protein [Hyphomicrobiales bacterium]